MSEPETQDQIPNDDPAITSTQEPRTNWKSWLNTSLLISTVILLFLSLILSLSNHKNQKVDPKEMMAAQAELTAKTAKVNAERANQGLPPLLALGTESPEQIAARLSKDANSLANMSDQLRQLLVEKEKIIAEKNNQLLLSEQARQALTSQLGKLQLQYENQLGISAGAESLKAQLAQAQAKLDALANNPAAEELALLERRNAELEAKLGSLAAASPSRPAPTNDSTGNKLFAESIQDLSPIAKGLCQGLSALEEQSDLEISAAYNRFASQYRASFVKEIRFPANSSQISPADQMALAEAVTHLPEGAMLLVVGYASSAGQPDENRKLSTEQVKNIAKNLELAKPGSQRVQAIQLGQTKRFSSRDPERNQVCEIWQINP